MKGDVYKLRAKIRSWEHILGADEVEEALELTRRSKYKETRAAIKSAPVDPMTSIAIAAYAHENPDMHHAEVARKFGVNAGRVSEALALYFS